jgi:DNA ligase-1
MLASAAPENLDALKYPTTASYKLDGVRCLIVNGTAYSRNMKPIPSRLVQTMFGHAALNGLDGELIAGPPNAEDVYRRTVSAVMSADAIDDVCFHVFDHYSNSALPHHVRLKIARKQITRPFQNCVYMVQHAAISDRDALLSMERDALAQGYEGLMIRDPFGTYKYGRATEREGLLLKLKRFVDGEATILSVDEQFRNENEQERDALGRAKRSSAKQGLVRTGVLGALTVEDVKSGVRFSVGSGFDLKERVKFWTMRDKLRGRIIKYRYFPGGVKDKPRFPTFCGFRNPMDM